MFSVLEIALFILVLEDYDSLVIAYFELLLLIMKLCLFMLMIVSLVALDYLLTQLPIIFNQ